MDNAIRFGVFLPVFVRGTNFDLILELTKFTEKLGLDSVWSCDHLLGVESVVKEPSKEYPPALESTVTLAALARETKRLRLGTAVSCIPYRNPPLYAKQIALLDVISNGRFELGFGAGWREKEFIAYDIPFRPFSKRLERTKEGIYLIKRLLEEESVSFDGKFIKIQNCQINPKPIQKPHPPFWLGAIGKRTLTELLPFADGWLPPAVSLDFIKSREPLVKEVEKKMGKRILKGIEFYTAIDKDRDLAIKRSNESIKEWFGYSIEEIDDLFLGDKRMKVELESSPFREVGKPALAVGGPDDCINMIEKYIKAGLSLFVLHFMPILESYQQLKIYAEKVIPYIKEEFG
ncbi:MAG: LLM class flavin-dependent oxidoreductase [Nitrososphaerales archaeon]